MTNTENLPADEEGAGPREMRGVFSRLDAENHESDHPSGLEVRPREDVTARRNRPHPFGADARPARDSAGHGLDVGGPRTIVPGEAQARPALFPRPAFRRGLSCFRRRVSDVFRLSRRIRASYRPPAGPLPAAGPGERPRRGGRERDGTSDRDGRDLRDRRTRIPDRRRRRRQKRPRRIPPGTGWIIPVSPRVAACRLRAILPQGMMILRHAGSHQ